jgi:hypothetical protein
MPFQIPRWTAWARAQILMLAAGCLLLTTSGVATAAVAAHAEGGAYRPAISTAALRNAATHSSQDERTLVADAQTLVACISSHTTGSGLEYCPAERTALQRAGNRLARAEQRLAALTSTSRSGTARIASSSREPRLYVSGERLTWTPLAHVRSYLLKREIPGEASQFSLVQGTSTAPPAVPGASVTYAVRAVNDWSTWSRHRTVTYPPRPGTNPTAPVTTTPPQETVSPQSAPTIVVSGRALEWNAIPGVGTYIVVSKIPGVGEKFTSVGATSLTPEALPGTTVHYRVRTAVYGSAWSSEVAISYPASTPTPTEPPAPKESPTPKESPAPGTGGFQFGINSGTNMTLDVGGAVKLGAKVVRIAFPIGTSAAQLEPVIAGYAAKGIRIAPLAYFYGTMPSSAEAKGLAGWAEAYGPGGTYWAAHGNSQLAIQTIEFGNETSDGYQYADNAGEPSYQARAQTYAIRLKEAAEAIAAGGVKVGLLAVAEDWTGDWMNGMFQAVPNLGSYVAGWVSHPYGSGWKSKIEDIISQAKAHGAPSTIPIDITEWGLATDNGRCLTENYGYNRCMTYNEAAETLRRDVTEIGALLGSRAGLFLIYQVRDQQPTGASSEREMYFGLLQHELQSKGAYTEAAEQLLAS